MAVVYQRQWGQVFFKRLEELGKDVRCLKDIKVGAIGLKTAEAVYAKGIKPDLVPDEYRAEAIVEAFKKEGAGNLNLNILLPRAAEAREILPDELKKMGARVDVVEAYRTVMPDKGADRIRVMLENGEIDMVTFTSSSTVINFVGMFGPDQVKRLIEKVAVACIGPITARTAEKHGLKVSIMPKDYTIEALVNAIMEYYS